MPPLGPDQIPHVGKIPPFQQHPIPIRIQPVPHPLNSLGILINAQNPSSGLCGFKNRFTMPARPQGAVYIKTTGLTTKRRNDLFD